ncbi:hypothetical protein, partial [Wolbachia pipientis]|uniref:hypothetical protein n=3 Tax=Wolbachia TaxID=953 RepID=UPI0015CFC48A
PVWNPKKRMMSSQCPDYLDPVFFTNSQKVLHSITQNPYSPNPMHYLQLSFLDPSSQATRMTPFWMETSVSYFHDTILFPGSK